MITEARYDTYLQALLAGRRAECSAVVRELLDDGIDLRTLYTDLFTRTMYRVGELWATHRITVANEHLATAITESLLNLAYPAVFSTARKGKKIVIGCCDQEFHQIGAKMVADIFELNGWDSYFLGANMPLADLQALIDDISPDMVGFSVSLPRNVNHLQRYIEEVRSTFTDLPVLVGGYAFTHGGHDKIGRYADVRYISSLENLEKWLEAEGNDQ